MFAKDQILQESEKNLIRKCLFVYQAKMYKEYSGVPQGDLDLISQIIDKLHLKQQILDDNPTYHIECRPNRVTKHYETSRGRT